MYIITLWLILTGLLYTINGGAIDSWSCPEGTYWHYGYDYLVCNEGTAYCQCLEGPQATLKVTCGSSGGIGLCGQPDQEILEFPGQLYCPDGLLRCLDCGHGNSADDPSSIQCHTCTAGFEGSTCDDSKTSCFTIVSK